MSKITFNRKPMPIFAEYRPMFKITQVLLILSLASRGKKSSLIRLHMINWALKDDSRRELLLESANKHEVLFGVWGVDPALNFSLQYALSEELIVRAGLSYKLANKGEHFIKQLSKKNVLEEDYKFLKSLGTRVTEIMVQEIVGAWE